MALINHLFVEANPIPVKMALYYMGLIKSPELRLPLVQMSEDLAQKMKQEMKSLGVI
jgi:4-hydroxy-tetrahydrodipicolinate synthase